MVLMVINTSLFCNPGGVEEDEALARRLQEQEDALATRGRATRGALRVPQKPSQAAQKGPSRDARHPRGSAGVRSSSRLKPEAVQGKQRPITRGSTGTLHNMCCVCICGGIINTANALFVGTSQLSWANWSAGIR